MKLGACSPLWWPALRTCFHPCACLLCDLPCDPLKVCAVMRAEEEAGAQQAQACGLEVVQATEAMEARVAEALAAQVRRERVRLW